MSNKSIYTIIKFKLILIINQHIIVLFFIRQSLGKFIN